MTPRVTASSSEANGRSCRAATIFCTVTAPMPGNASSSSGVAVFRLTSPPSPPVLPSPPATAPLEGGGSEAFAPMRGMTTCSPSARGCARLMVAAVASRSTSGPYPPAAAIASAIRDPPGSSRTPGCATAPSTSTTIVASLLGDDALADGPGSDELTIRLVASPASALWPSTGSSSIDAAATTRTITPPAAATRMRSDRDTRSLHGGGEQDPLHLRPKLGARALGAGLRKQEATLRQPCLLASYCCLTYWTSHVRSAGERS